MDGTAQDDGAATRYRLRTSERVRRHGRGRTLRTNRSRKRLESFAPLGPRLSGSFFARCWSVPAHRDPRFLFPQRLAVPTTPFIRRDSQTVDSDFDIQVLASFATLRESYSHAKAQGTPRKNHAELLNQASYESGELLRICARWRKIIKSRKTRNGWDTESQARCPKPMGHWELRRSFVPAGF
jgi:hypothetical protein